MAELSEKARKLFDAHADGVIDDRNYEVLMKDIQAEQEELEQKLSDLQTKISQQHNTAISIEQFRETVMECLNVTKLTPYILNKLISKIEVGYLETVDEEKQQILYCILKKLSRFEKPSLRSDSQTVFFFWGKRLSPPLLEKHSHGLFSTRPRV